MKVIFAEADDERVERTIEILRKQRKYLDIVPAKRQRDRKDTYKICIENFRDSNAEVLLAGAQVAHAEFLPLVFKAFSVNRERNLLFSLAPVEWKARKRRFLFMDPVVVLDPTVEELSRMIISAMKVVQMILKERPRVCLISHVSRKDLPTKKTKQGRVIATLLRKGVRDVVESPLQLDAALDASAAQIKIGELGGSPNLLVMPDITSANILYKSIEIFGGDTVEVRAALLWKLPSKGIIGLLPRTCTSTQIEHSVDYLVNLAEMIREPEER